MLSLPTSTFQISANISLDSEPMYHSLHDKDHHCSEPRVVWCLV
jgi:hypothetical protein